MIIDLIRAQFEHDYLKKVGQAECCHHVGLDPVKLGGRGHLLEARNVPGQDVSSQIGVSITDDTAWPVSHTSARYSLL